MSWFNDWNAEKQARELEAARQQLKRDRDNALSQMTHTLADGAVVQVRPQDLPNFQLAIQAGQPKLWILADNTTRLTTVAELQSALADGIAQGEAIWEQYALDLQALNTESNPAF